MMYVFMLCNYVLKNILRVSDQNGISLLYIMFEIHHSGQEPLICVLNSIYIYVCS